MKFIPRTIKTNEDAYAMVENFKRCAPHIGAFDTETTGLHIINDKPFLFVFGWAAEEQGIIYTYVVDLEQQPDLAYQVIYAWHSLIQTLDKYLAHNMKFDLHMMTNIGIPPSNTLLYSDTMFYIRFAHDAIPMRKGGVPLALKDYAVRYIDRRASNYAARIKIMQSNIARDLNTRLSQRLGWTRKQTNDFFNDTLMDITDLPEEKQQAYLDWKLLDLPPEIKLTGGQVEVDDVPYHILDRTKVIQYAHYDVYLTLRVYYKLAPIIAGRQNEYALDLEERLIIPFYEMERVGFNVDVAYLKETKATLKQVILKERAQLCVLAKQHIKSGQHKVVKDILNNVYGLNIHTTNKDELDKIYTNLKQADADNPAIEFIHILQLLRRLEKWYAVYLLRFMKMLTTDNKLYTMINQVSTVSGRVSSDFQQFPKEGIKYKDNIIFNPRRLVKVPGDMYPEIIYLDYSQIELRVQALYTILIGHPDKNLCRAYMPYDCVNINGEWYLNEDHSIQWTPLDVHGHTTKIAFEITEDHPEFKKHRHTGKTINFAKNYGATITRIAAMFPEYGIEQIRKIDDSYYIAFPGIKQYHKFCMNLARCQSYATNLFGARYYNVSGHNLINMLIQGSAAYLLKEKIYEIWRYCKKHHIKSKFQMNIHDELSWIKHKDDPIEVFFKFKEIMETWEDAHIPIIADMEHTYTTWADKEGIKIA